VTSPVAGDVGGIVVESFIEIGEGRGGVSTEEVLGSLDWNLLAVYEEELADRWMEVVDEIVVGGSTRIEDIGADAEALAGQEGNGESVAIVGAEILDPTDLGGAVELGQTGWNAAVVGAENGDAVAGGLGCDVAIDLADASNETTDEKQTLGAVSRFGTGLGIGGSDTGELVAVQAGDGEASALEESGASLAR
jgi:hypothetical protein